MIDEEKLDRIMLEMGHGEGISGTRYIRFAVKMYRDGMIITRELYPAIAKEFDVAPCAAERAIRHSIEKVFLNSPMKVQEKYFGNVISMNSGKITNKDYIARLAYLCRMKGK